MTGFTAVGGRRYVFHGTLGEVILEEGEDYVMWQSFNGDGEKHSIEVLAEGGYGHGGGDSGMIDMLGDMLAGKASQATSLEASLESHLIGICAEESRKKGGELVYIRKQA
jgi:hypothetical protein